MNFYDGILDKALINICINPQKWIFRLQIKDRLPGWLHLPCSFWIFKHFHNWFSFCLKLFQLCNNCGSFFSQSLLKMQRSTIMLNNTVHCEDVSGNFSIYLNCAHIYLPPNQYIHKPGATKRTSQDPIFSF